MRSTSPLSAARPPWRRPDRSCRCRPARCRRPARAAAAPRYRRPGPASAARLALAGADRQVVGMMRRRPPGLPGGARSGHAHDRVDLGRRRPPAPCQAVVERRERVCAACTARPAGDGQAVAAARQRHPSCCSMRARFCRARRRAGAAGCCRRTDDASAVRPAAWRPSSAASAARSRRTLPRSGQRPARLLGCPASIRTGTIRPSRPRRRDVDRLHIGDCGPISWPACAPALEQDLRRRPGAPG